MIGKRYVDQIKGFEGYNPKPYWDYKQWTSGYGTRGSPGEVVDRATADQRLGSELGSAYQRVNAFAPQAPEGVKAALTSLTFNAGDKWMGAGLGGLIKAGDYGAAKNRFLAYNKAGGATLPGLAKRRAAEASWFDGTTVQGGSMAPRGRAGGLAAISPEWANNIVQMGGGSAAPGGTPTAEDDEYLKALASQMVQPYRPGWAGVAGISNSIVGGLAMRELRQNQAARRGENADAMRAYTAPVGGGMAAPQQAPLAPLAEAPTVDGMTPRDRSELSGMLNPGGMAAGPRAPVAPAQSQGDMMAARMDRAQRVIAMAPNSPAAQMAMRELQALQAKQMEMADPMRQLDQRYKEAQIKKLEAGDANTPETRAQTAQRFGLTPGTPKYESYVLTGKMGRDEPMSATDRKAIMTAEDELPAIESTIASLDRAISLNDKTFTGAMSGARGWAGSALPDWMVPDVIADPKTAEAQREFDQLTRGEAIKAMSATLKGATTDREMAQFVEILANSSTPPDVRRRTLERLKQLAVRQLDTSKGRINSLRGGDYYKPGYEPSKAPQQTAAPGALAPGSYVYDPATGELRPR